MSRATKTLVGVFLRAWGRGKATLLTVTVALLLATLTPAFGATGGNFILGKSNSATTISRLTANVARAPALQIFNTNTAPASTALNLVVAAGHPPLWVNPTAGKATNLNADKLDGKSAADLTRVAQMDTQDTTPIGRSAVTYGQVLSITAPADGFVRVNGNVTVFNYAIGGCTSVCAYQGYIRHIEDGASSVLSQGDVTGETYDNIAMDKVFPVNAGANTFDIRLSGSANRRVA